MSRWEHVFETFPKPPSFLLCVPSVLKVCFQETRPGNSSQRGVLLYHPCDTYSMLGILYKETAGWPLDRPPPYTKAKSSTTLPTRPWHALKDRPSIIHLISISYLPTMGEVFLRVGAWTCRGFQNIKTKASIDVSSYEGMRASNLTAL